MLCICSYDTICYVYVHMIQYVTCMYTYVQNDVASLISNYYVVLLVRSILAFYQYLLKIVEKTDAHF